MSDNPKNPSQPVTRHPVDLTTLADRVRRLSPCHRDPERFHADKSEIEAALPRLARDGG